MDREDLTSVIIGCAYKIYNTLGFGFLELVYEKCLLVELEKAGISAEAQKDILVQYVRKYCWRIQSGHTG